MKRVIDILLVESEVSGQQEVTRVLMKRNILHRLTTVSSSDEALTFLTNTSHYRIGKPDVILFDIDIPGMQGMETLSAIHAHPEWRDIKLFILHPADFPLDRTRALALGASGFFTKPLRLENPSTLDAFNLMIDIMNL